MRNGTEYYSWVLYEPKAERHEQRSETYNSGDNWYSAEFQWHGEHLKTDSVFSASLPEHGLSLYDSYLNSLYVYLYNISTTCYSLDSSMIRQI